ncbi:Disease resistance RPP13-like protein 4 [Glycine soja]|nr:Disease resistance RPP13-like protein 4 [Glycine soja]
MSIRTNRFKAVDRVLKDLERVEKEGKLNDLKSELNKIKEVFLKVKENEEELLDTLAVVDGYIRNKNIAKLREEEGHFCQKIWNSTLKLLPAAHHAQAAASSHHVTPLPSSTTPQLQEEDLEMIKDCYNNLGNIQKLIFSSLLQFPENAVFKRMEIALWFSRYGDFNRLLGSKLTVPHGNGKSPIASKFKINPLLRHKSLSPLFQNQEVPICGYYSQIKTSSSSPASDIGYERLVLDQRKIKISDGFGFKSLIAVYNVGASYLNFGPGFKSLIAVFNFGASYLNFGPGWMAKMKDLQVLHLGRFMQDSPKHHIEVDSEEFLKELSGHEDLRYLSLRGISRIFELPPSIVKINRLRILDLKACHNLETLPGHKYLGYLSLRGISRIFELPPSIVKMESLQYLDLKACHNLETLPSDISSLRWLWYLNLSECCLLDRMPEGIENLTRLKVLKGFVLGSSSKTPCRISDIAANLKRLVRLSIRIGSGAVIQEGEFESLKKLSELEHLKISWGVFDTRYIDIQISVPSSLKKLHLEGFPGQNIPEWLKPSKLPQELELRELHITGGKLKSLDHGENNDWVVEMVYLKYLKDLDVDLEHLRKLFPSLRYVEIKQILNQPYLEWSIN